MARVRSEAVAAALALVALLGCRTESEPGATSGAPAVISPTMGGWGSSGELAKLPGTIWYVAESTPPLLMRIRDGVHEQIAEAIVPHAQLTDGRLVGVRRDGTRQQVVLVGDDRRIEAIGPVVSEIREVIVGPSWIVATTIEAAGGAPVVVRIDLVSGAVVSLGSGSEPERLRDDRLVLAIDGDLVTVPLAGGAREPLVTAPGNDSSPRSSPDRTALLYISDREGPLRLYLRRGDDERRLTDRVDARDEHSARWSPDGRLVTYVVQRGQRRHVWIRDVENRSEIDVTLEGILDETPTFSPDGRWILVTRTRGHDVDLWAIPTGVGEPLRVTTGRFPDVHACWL